MDLFYLFIASWYLVSLVFLNFFRHLLQNLNLLSCSSISFCHHKAKLVKLG